MKLKQSGCPFDRASFEFVENFDMLITDASHALAIKRLAVFDQSTQLVEAGSSPDPQRSGTVPPLRLRGGL